MYIGLFKKSDVPLCLGAKVWALVERKEKTKQKIKFMQNSPGKRIEASQGNLNEVIKATIIENHEGEPNLMPSSILKPCI